MQERKEKNKNKEMSTSSVRFEPSNHHQPSTNPKDMLDESQGHNKLVGSDNRERGGGGVTGFDVHSLSLIIPVKVLCALGSRSPHRGLGDMADTQTPASPRSAPRPGLGYHYQHATQVPKFPAAYEPVELSTVRRMEPRATGTRGWGCFTARSLVSHVMPGLHDAVSPPRK